MSNERVTVAVEDHVALVKLNRAAKYNALDHAMFEGIIEAGLSLYERKDVRAVVLTGDGDNFCAGLDMSLFQQSDSLSSNASENDSPPGLLALSDGGPSTIAQRVATVWRELDRPVIAALSGYVFGGGLQIALGADMRYANPNVKMSVMEIRWGIIPDMSISVTLPELCRLDIARELIYSGRIVEGEEAREIGLVTRLADDPVAAAMDMARQIAGHNPDAIAAAKKLMRSAGQGIDGELLNLEAALQTPLLGSPNQMEAVAANLQKRAANFDQS